MKYLIYFAVFLTTINLSANINFGSVDSMIKVGDTSVLDVESALMYVNGGHINRTEFGEIMGNPIYFTRGKMSSYLSTSNFSGKYEGNTNNIDAFRPYYDPNELHYGVLELGFNTDPTLLDFVISNPGGFRQKIYVKSGQQILRGQPLFFGANDIVLQNSTCLLSIAIQNTLNTNIIMNGGAIVLQDDLSLGDDAIFVGDGQVVFNNRRLSLGGNSAYWTGNIIWNSAFDLQLNSLTYLHGTWSFYGDSQVNGNGNVIDFSGGGSIIVYPGSVLRLSGVKLKGLGSGNLIMGEGSQLRLSDVDIEMNADFTFNSGDVVVDGDSYVLVKDKLLTFAENQSVPGIKGTLTVDRVALTYDPLDFEDKLNIRPLAIQDPTHQFIKVINNGSIRKPRIESITFVSYGTNTAMARYAMLYKGREMTIYNNSGVGLPTYITVNGGGQFIGFSLSDTPLLLVEDNVNVTFQNAYFRDVLPEYISLGQGATLTFGDNTNVKLWDDAILKNRWTFKGNTFLRGGGAILTLDEEGEIVLEGENSVLYIEGIMFKGLSGNKIRCTSNTSRIIFKDVQWIQDGDFDFDLGGMEVLGDLFLIGPGKQLTLTGGGDDVDGAYTFNYRSDRILNILDNGSLAFSKGMKFNYEPVDGNPNLIQMANKSATITLDESVLSAPAPGLQLTVGRLIINKRCFYKNDNATTPDSGIIFGDGLLEDNLFIEQGGGSSFERLTGFVQNQNV